jgi:DNA-binding transcriptional MerR regulator
MTRTTRHALLTPTARRALGVHSETLRRYVKEGMIPAKKEGGRWRFNPKDIVLFKKFGPPSGRVCDVARALGVHRNTVLSWEASGKIQSFDRTAGGRRFRREDVIRLARKLAKGSGKRVGEVCPFCGRSVGANRGKVEAKASGGHP